MTEYKMNFTAKLSVSGSLDHQITSVEQLLDQEPFSPEIREWFRSHTEVRDALKIIIRNRFVPIHAISIVNNPLLKGVKQSIGIYSIDTKQKNQIKQDYLMNEEDDTFVLFTGLPDHIKPSNFVQHVNMLKDRYGKDGLNFYNDHHQELNEVSPKIRPCIEQALKELSK